MKKLSKLLSDVFTTVKNIIHFRITKPIKTLLKSINWFRILGDILSTIIFIPGIVWLIFLIFTPHFWKTLASVLVGGGLVTAAMYIEMYFESLGNKDES